MSGRYFLDTNILAYCFDDRAPVKAEIAKALLRDGLRQRTAIVSYQVVQEFFHVAQRRFEPAMSLPEAQQFLSSVFSRLLAVQSSVSLYAEALVLKDRYRLSWWDSLIVAAALEGNVEILYTEDLQDGQRFGSVVVRNPFLNR